MANPNYDENLLGLRPAKQRPPITREMIARFVKDASPDKIALMFNYNSKVFQKTGKIAPLRVGEQAGDRKATITDLCTIAKQALDALSADPPDLSYLESLVGAVGWLCQTLNGNAPTYRQIGGADPAL